jgi:hypothetical protein
MYMSLKWSPGWTMFLERKTIGRLEGKQAFYFGASQGATALADAVSCSYPFHVVCTATIRGDDGIFLKAKR